MQIMRFQQVWINNCMKVNQIIVLENMDFPTYVLGVDHCFMIDSRANVVQKALNAYGGQFHLVDRKQYEETPPHSQVEMSLQDFLNYLKQTHQTDRERGYGG